MDRDNLWMVPNVSNHQRESVAVECFMSYRSRSAPLIGWGLDGTAIMAKYHDEVTAHIKNLSRST
jgi:hypothetical protein